MHAADGKRLTYLLENRLDAQHPDAPFLADNSLPEIGTLTAADGQTLYYRLYKPRRFDPTQRYPAIVDVYGGPGVQRVLDNWTGSTFAQILTRAGYVVFQLDNRGSAFRGTAFQAPNGSDARRNKSTIGVIATRMIWKNQTLGRLNQPRAR